MKIHYIQPYSIDKNIGLAINEAVKAINYAPDDWFILTDHDMMWLLPDSKAQVEQILHGTDYDILGCMTNRIRSTEQLVNNQFIENDNVRTHIRMATRCRENFGDRIKGATGVVAAFMLCFRVSVWEKVGGFVENSITFDWHFNNEARKIAGAKVGIMQGVYVFHSYRLWSDKPLKECNHLINK